MLRDLFSLFPAYAGVILKPLALPMLMYTFPRICGGDPHIQQQTAMSYNFSPHMRGYF